MHAFPLPAVLACATSAWLPYLVLQPAEAQLPMRILQKHIFNKKWVLSKVKLSSLLPRIDQDPTFLSIKDNDIYSRQITIQKLSSCAQLLILGWFSPSWVWWSIFWSRFNRAWLSSAPACFMSLFSINHC